MLLKSVVNFKPVKTKKNHQFKNIEIYPLTEKHGPHSNSNIFEDSREKK